MPPFFTHPLFTRRLVPARTLPQRVRAATMGHGLALALLLWATGASVQAQPGVPYDRTQLSKELKACAHLFPASKPLSLDFAGAGWNAVGLCSDQFAVVYSPRSKTALTVVEKLNRQVLGRADEVPRKDEFFPDPRLSAKERAELRDYKAQEPAVDRGHLAPAGNAASARAMLQSFALSNTVPQDPTHNRGSWRKIEADVQKYVRRAKGEVYVFTGPVFNPALRAVGRNQVWVPSHLYKVVYDPTEQRAWAYLSANKGGPVEPPVSYSEFVRRTGLALLPGVTLR